MTAFIVASIIAIAIIGLLLVMELIGLTILLFTLKNLVQDIRERVDPVVNKTSQLLQTANRVADSVQDKTEHVTQTATRVSDTVAKRVDRTTWLVQQVVSLPAIAVMSFFSGVRGGFRAWRSTRRMHRSEEAVTFAPSQPALVLHPPVARGETEESMDRAA